jgi:adenylate cyclase
MIPIGRQSPPVRAVGAISDSTQNVARDPAGTPRPSAVEVRAELERILASRCFEQAARSSKFLRFVVEQTLAGHGDRLKGYTIAIEVFGRPPDFDAQSDPLVRVEAGRLRRRLTEYYADEGRSDPLRIELPRGSYTVTSSYHPSPAEVLLGPMPENTAEQNAAAHNRRRWRRIRSVLIAAVVLGVLAVVMLQQVELSRLTPNQAPTAQSRVARVGKPPIVVLAFEDLGIEPTVPALAATLREELLLLLDDPELFVIVTPGGSDAASPTVPGTDANSGGYVLSGSVRAMADAIRVTARLVEPETGRQIWSDAYDQPLGSLDEPGEQRALARRIATVAEPYGPIFESEITRVRALPAVELPVSDCVLKYYDFRRVLDRPRHADALACFEAATQREPTSAEAWGLLSILAVEQAPHGYATAVRLDDAREAARRAMDIDGDNLHANLALAGTQFFGGEDFRPVAERVLQTWPDNSEAQAFLGFMFVASGDAARGRALVERAIDSTQRPPSGYHSTLALAALRQGNVDEALASALRIDSPDWAVGHVIVAAAAALAGRADLAARARARALALDPTAQAGITEALRRWRMEPMLAAELERGFEAAGRP